MPNRIAVNTLQASTMDILNVIRANASAEYQELVPEISTINEIPRVGEVLYGYPAMANQFIASLMNRIALVRLQGATFNNRFAPLKKGYLEFGETIEEIFVELIKVRAFNPEKAEAREHKRTLPDVRTAFHIMNWRAQYPITVSNTELRTAFQSESGVRDLIERIVRQVYTAADYDEWLLFKYLLIKAVSHGKMHPVAIGDGNMQTAAKEFRGMSNLLEFMSDEYSAAGVHTATPRAKQYIFMDARYNAAYDVDVLASAFNMEKADFMGHLILVDDWTKFDNKRFEEIRSESDAIEEVTPDELELMQGVKAVLCDEEWFQVYDNYTGMTEKFVASGLYWNYFYHQFKTISSSPFANAVVFALDGANVAVPDTIDVMVDNANCDQNVVVYTLRVKDIDAGLTSTQATFIQTEEATELGIGVHKYGAILMPTSAEQFTLLVKIGDAEYVSGIGAVTRLLSAGTTLKLNRI